MVDNLVDNVDNFYGSVSLHNYIFWSIFSLLLWIIYLKVGS